MGCDTVTTSKDIKYEVQLKELSTYVKQVSHTRTHRIYLVAINIRLDGAMMPFNRINRAPEAGDMITFDVIISCRICSAFCRTCSAGRYNIERCQSGTKCHFRCLVRMLNSITYENLPMSDISGYDKR